MKLKENEGTKCPKCESLFVDKQEKCYDCDTQTQPTTYYTRTRVERYAFSVACSAIVAIVALLAGGSLEAFGGAFLISLIIILSTFYSGQFLLGIGGGFKEIYPPENKPAESELAFSWPKFFLDFLVLLGISVALFVVIGIVKLVKYLVS